MVQDLTSGRTLTKTTICKGEAGCPRTSAEVISEDISHSGGDRFPLPNHRTQTYANIAVDGHTGTLNDPTSQLNRITEVSDGVTKQTTSALSADETSFRTTWEHE